MLGGKGEGWGAGNGGIPQKPMRMSTWMGWPPMGMGPADRTMTGAMPLMESLMHPSKRTTRGGEFLRSGWSKGRLTVKNKTDEGKYDEEEHSRGV